LFRRPQQFSLDQTGNGLPVITEFSAFTFKPRRKNSMSRFTIAAFLPFAFCCGCSDDSAATGTSDDSSATSVISADGDSLGTPTDNMTATNDSAAAGNNVALTPDNTAITFVGIHVGDKPEPQNGRFTAFTGSAELTDGKLTSVSVDIETVSVTADVDGLTTHLKSPDFFDVREQPTAEFKSTGIEAGDGDAVTITGDLTLLGKTQSISFPATVTSDGGLKLSAEFSIDRSEFGMNFGLDKIDKSVAMKITIGG
jgi:polyisoprenoid-binding protein YceI